MLYDIIRHASTSPRAQFPESVETQGEIDTWLKWAKPTIAGTLYSASW
jgi:hypothetical protein